MITGNEPIALVQSLKQGGNQSREVDFDYTETGTKGLTICQYFAGIAMQGLLANGSFFDKKLQLQAKTLNVTISEVIAVSAVDIAEALIKELNRNQS